MENHYKDGFWEYPEFAQKMDRFVDIVDSDRGTRTFRCPVRSIKRDRCRMTIRIELLTAIADRVVSMHASDRYWPKAYFDELRQSDGTSAIHRNCATGTGKD